MIKKYTLYLIDPKTGKTLNSDGQFLIRGDDFGYNNIFNNIEDAKLEKNNILKKVVWASVMIYEERRNKYSYYSNREIELQYLDEHIKFNNYFLLPWYKKILIKKPTFKYYSHKK